MPRTSINLLIDWGPSIKYVTLFLANFNPPPSVTLCHTSRDPPKGKSHISDPPIFYRPSTKNPGQKPPEQIFSQLFAGVFVRGFCHRVFCVEGFVRSGFCPFPFCQKTYVTTES